MSFTFAKATKKQSRLRLAIVGPSGSGKTYTALSLACALADMDKGRVAVIDTERGSAALYADIFGFDVLELDQYEPLAYVDAIKAAEKAGYTHLVVDSLSHAWAGKGGALEMVDNSARRGGNKFGAWRDVTPQQHALVDSIVGSRCHVVATMRSKTEWVLEDNGRGKQAPRRVGTAPVQRDGVEYEFTIVGEMDLEHSMVISKSRCAILADKVIQKPGRQVAEVLHTWLNEGAPAPAIPRTAESMLVEHRSSLMAQTPSIPREYAQKMTPPEPPHPAVDAALATFPGSRVAQPEPTVDALREVLHRMYPGDTEQAKKEREEWTLRAMGGPRVPRGKTYLTLFATGTVEQRQSLIDKALDHERRMAEPGWMKEGEREPGAEG